MGFAVAIAALAFAISISGYHEQPKKYFTEDKRKNLTKMVESIYNETQNQLNATATAWRITVNGTRYTVFAVIPSITKDGVTVTKDVELYSGKITNEDLKRPADVADSGDGTFTSPTLTELYETRRQIVANNIDKCNLVDGEIRFNIGRLTDIPRVRATMTTAVFFVNNRTITGGEVRGTKPMTLNRGTATTTTKTPKMKRPRTNVGTISAGEAKDEIGSRLPEAK